jgi:DNA-binding transcriptional LysR family regulator
MTQLPDFEAWAIFAKVAEKGSFSQAAHELGLAKTTVSKAVTRLEERMRTTLLSRTTRQLSLTESGRISLQRAARILAEGTAVEAEILADATVPQGQLRIASTIAFGAGQLAPLLPEFMKKYPKVDVDLHLTDSPIDMIADGFDIALRLGQIAESSLRISRLFSYRLPLVASPEYFARHGRPQHPSELERFPTLIYTHIAASQDWQFSHRQHGHCSVHVNGRFRFNNGMAAVPALVAGVAITLQPEIYIWRELEDGRLEEVLSDWDVPPVPVHILTPPGHAHPARLRVLIEFLRKHFAAMPWAKGVQT